MNKSNKYKIFNNKIKIKNSFYKSLNNRFKIWLYKKKKLKILIIKK